MTWRVCNFAKKKKNEKRKKKTLAQKEFDQVPVTTVRIRRNKFRQPFNFYRASFSPPLEETRSVSRNDKLRSRTRSGPYRG